jgi:hypothetical protein
MARISMFILAFLLMQGTPPPDKHIGAAMFRVAKTERAGKFVYLQPLMVPLIEATRLEGDKILDTTIVKCEVIERFLTTAEKSIISVTILKCGGVEYGVEGVDFVMETK